MIGGSEIWLYVQWKEKIMIDVIDVEIGKQTKTDSR